MYIPLPNFETIYEINVDGDIRKMSTKRSIKHHTDLNGYSVVYPFNGVKTTTLGVHRAIAIAFIPNPFNKQQVNHIDGDKQNNAIDNLEWVTPQENTIHSVNVLGNNVGTRGNTYVHTDDELILSLLGQGLSQCKVAEITGTPQSTISKIKCGTRFKYQRKGE